MKTIRAFLVLATVTILAGSCSSGQKKSEYGPNSTQTSVRPSALTREAAFIRARQIARTAYVLWFGLDETHADFEGRVVVNFELRPRAKDHSSKVFMDFAGGTLKSLSINGGPIADASTDTDRYDGNRIHFKLSELQPGMNRIEMSFSHPFSKNGNGLHRFVDPEDQRVYIYSNFEPYNARRMFPCFDQPDIKASFELTVEAPDGWQVISNTKEREITGVDGRKSWAFPPSPELSSYVFALHAGPYAQWKADANGIPMRLFARKSLAKYVDFKEWFEVTEKGLDFFATQFGYPYPYAKYDQILVPEFNAGAMENAGAVTFSEHMVYRTRVTQDRRRGRADTILHEMAHMWFGDLVTMRWWNGLWLNESFATFMSAWAIDEATRFKGSWQSFFAGMKQWAYWEDQLVTTHPIEGPVPDTDHAQTQFDGITYGKGAAVLKQLKYYLGEDDFREGIQRYFQKFALKNTTVTDFIKMLAEASGKDLSKWSHAWLQTSGVNSIRADWACETDPETGKSLISKFNLTQKPSPVNRELRPHRTKIALYYTPSRTTGPLRTKNPTEITYSHAETPIPSLVRKPCPAFVFPNHDDHDYAKVELDPVSLSFAINSLSRIDDPFARQMIWHTLWEMVRDGSMRAQDYAETVFAHSKKETNTQILSRILQQLVDRSSGRPSVLRYLPEQLRADYQTRIETFFLKNLQIAPAGSDTQLVWFNAFLSSASNTASVDFVRALLTGQKKLGGLKIDQEKRWDLVRVLARTNAADIAELIAKESKADPSEIGQRAAISAEASIPTRPSKDKWLAQILGYRAPQALPLAKLREAMWSFNLLGQEELTRATVDSYFEMLGKLESAGTEDEEFAWRFTGNMFPYLCDPAIVERVADFLDSNSKLPAPMVKSLKISRQEEERCIRARAKSQVPSELTPSATALPDSGPSQSPSAGAPRP